MGVCHTFIQTSPSRFNPFTADLISSCFRDMHSVVRHTTTVWRGSPRASAKELFQDKVLAYPGSSSDGAELRTGVRPGEEWHRQAACGRGRRRHAVQRGGDSPCREEGQLLACEEGELIGSHRGLGLVPRQHLRVVHLQPCCMLVLVRGAGAGEIVSSPRSALAAAQGQHRISRPADRWSPVRMAVTHCALQPLASGR